MAVYGYCRVGDDGQQEKTETLAMQRQRLDEYCRDCGVIRDRTFVDRGVDGTRPLGDRPQGGRLLARLGQGDVVMASRLDRLFRSAQDALTICASFRTAGVSLHLIDLGGNVSEDGTGRFLQTVLAAVAVSERDRIGDRIRDVKAEQRIRNRYLGGFVPFGWRKTVDGDMVSHLAEQAAIQRMIVLRNQGGSLRAIAGVMSAEGFQLTHAGVQKIIRAAERRDGSRRGLPSDLM